MGKDTKDEQQEKCFVIMPISDQGDYSTGHFTKVYEQIIKPAVIESGYVPYRVDENNICDAIINKIFAAIQECPMAICDLSSRNPNVLYELGLRQAYDKPVVLIQDDKTEKIFDVSGISTVFYSSMRLYENVIEARKNIREAILSTKAGNTSSLAKIVKASTPDFSKVEVSQDDRVKVILDGIYSELRQISCNENRVINNIVYKEGSYDRLMRQCSELERQFDVIKENENVKKEELYEILYTINKLWEVTESTMNTTKENLLHVKKRLRNLEKKVTEKISSASVICKIENKYQ